ncbi:MAG: hypothetical protein IJF05_05305 [Clostridia bacterium]|nr:hypothetical protein [Clostridia bacterium]
MTGLTKKELSRSLKELRADISALVKGLDTLLKAHKNPSELLRASLKEYGSAKAAFEKKDTAKSSARLERATADLKAAYGTYLDSKKALDDCNNSIIIKYTRLIEVAEAVSDREQAKAISERDTYKEEYEIRVAKVERGVADNLPDPLTAKPAEDAEIKEDAADTEKAEEEKTDEAASEPAPTPVRPAASATVASVNVAPVTIDISAYVERAISATMERLTVGMERRIDAYLASLVIPTPELPKASEPVAIPASAPAEGADAATVDAVATTSRANNELMTHLLDEQTHIYEKLRTMITNVQGLVDGMTDLSAAYFSLAQKEKDAIEIQKQLNDLQRHTAREQQGVQVNQKMISEEQIAISAEQALLADRQKATADRQAGLLESQRVMEETQKALVETHVALEEAMREVMQAQKEIIATQQAIINGNAKNIDAQKAIMEKQAEITAAQKEALAAHKQLLREQKAHNDKLSAKAPRAKKPASASEGDSEGASPSAEGALVTEKPAPPTDLSALSADDGFRD